MSNKKIFAVDFDGTIVKYAFPKIGEPLSYGINYLKKLQGQGHKIILHTMRSGQYLIDAVEFCKEHGLELYGINENPDQHTWSTSPKPYSHLYIDDSAAGCPVISQLGEEKPYVDWKKIEIEIEIKFGIMV